MWSFKCWRVFSFACKSISDESEVFVHYLLISWVFLLKKFREIYLLICFREIFVFYTRSGGVKFPLTLQGIHLYPLIIFTSLTHANES